MIECEKWLFLFAKVYDINIAEQDKAKSSSDKA